MTDIEKADVLRKAADIMSTEWGSEPIDEMREYADALDQLYRSNIEEQMRRNAIATREYYTRVSETDRELERARSEAQYWCNMCELLHRELRQLERMEENND